jgi:hypothetical protein
MAGSKRRPFCNGTDRGCVVGQHHPARKGADFPLVSAYVKRLANRLEEAKQMSAECKALAGAASDGSVVGSSEVT